MRWDAKNNHEADYAMDAIEKERMIEYLYSMNRKGPKLGLERMRDLLHRLGDPQDSFVPVLIGGTNGKGSTSAILSSILRESGYRTGVYTSPHLSSITERIAFDGKNIGEEDLFRIVQVLKDVSEKIEREGFHPPTFFEMMTAAAFLYFKEKRCDFAVLEVGMGGRLDATNVTNPPVSIITNISLEHTKILGDTKAKIAFEKAGIVKDGGLLISSEKDREAIDVFDKVCKERSSRMMRVGKEITVMRRGYEYSSGNPFQEFDISLPFNDGHGAIGPAMELKGLHLALLGDHQVDNAACAIAAAFELARLGHKMITRDPIRRGLERVIWPGRLEIMQKKPLVILDCAKDLEAMRSLRKSMESYFMPQADGGKLVLVISISSDKDWGGMLDTIMPICGMVVATAHNVKGRALDPGMIAEKAAAYSKKYLIIRSVKDAVKEAVSLAGDDGIVLVTGSVFAVGEARSVWIADNKDGLGRELNEGPRSEDR